MLGKTLYSTFIAIKIITKASWFMADSLYCYKNYIGAANIAFTIWSAYF